VIGRGTEVGVPAPIQFGSRDGCAVHSSEDDGSVITILVRDHEEVERRFAELNASLGSTDDRVRHRRRDLVDRVITDLVRHATAEESTVFPRVRERVSAEGAERLVHQHAAIEKTMKRLDGMSAGNPAFDRLVAVLMDQVREHVADEELEILPELRRMLSARELIELGAEVEAAKRSAPTRPHPLAPNRPPANKLVGPIIGRWDSVRDLVRHRRVGR
jgi:hemerythrin-like domain-containing protein